ncbi:MAG TPA: hypothetical protein VJ874_04645 [Candidatus Thermoplasmatota archaeon]|nr:hypothetical protein [Candidatus Thermoplasmatota archaeon]
MHLLESPHASASGPAGAQDFRAPVPSLVDAFTTALVGQDSRIGVAWEMPRNGLQVMEGNGSLWVDVQGVVSYPGVNGGCFWNILLRADEAGGGGFSGTHAACIAEESLVAPGIRELHLDFGSVDVSATQGDTVSLTVAINGVYGPNGSVHVLSGSSQHDSHVSLRGWGLPSEGGTLA